ncbi:MBL fold metallo-hydrolase [Salsipaludibacter albus]|uniref:MBL fold metallo-hydrolase n=1 Tax=Salsipaludibacter albus TaxID=2849650 RepID=UPI001EE41C12|nr:MBL fold metallo-hydrolase [Salsipaludibacter albus]MBY5164178.1 MBL fold metallo-hydrolase [Salsipaludibacter albus]
MTTTPAAEPGGHEPSDEQGQPQIRLDRHDDEQVIAVDTFTGGMSHVTAGFLLTGPRPALVETGPALAVDALLAGLASIGMSGDELATIVLTHIHLDHAGGAGDVAAAFPNAEVVVCDVGARHLHDPERLNASARRVYGPLHDTVYGDCTPIPTERIRAVGDGDVVDLGDRHLEVLYTPGHAKHHIGLFDPDTGAIYSGDSVGVKLPGMTAIRPATPPADFHLEAALDSLERYRERDPARLFLAHYGPVDPPLEALDEAAERLRLWADTAEAAWYASSELDHVAETLAARFADEYDPEAVADDPYGRERLELLSGAASNAAGLVRYFQRRDEGTLTDVG